MKTYLIITSLMLLIPPIGNAMRKPNCKHDDNTFRCVKYVRNYDGDTITFDIPNVNPLLGQNAKIRVYGIDSPEIKTHNKCEGKKALLAKRMVHNLLRKASIINLLNCKRGKYFRLVCDVEANGKSLSKYLLQYDLAYPYFGKKKAQIDWCNFKNKKTNI